MVCEAHFSAWNKRLFLPVVEGEGLHLFLRYWAQCDGR